MLEKNNYKNISLNLVNHLVKLYNNGQFNELLNKGIKLEHLYPYSVELLNILGSANLALEKYKKAIKFFEQASILNYNNPIIYYNLGLAYYQDGNMKDAIINYKKAIKLKPNYAEAYCNLGMCLKKIGDLKEAAICYQKSLLINPSFCGAYYNLGEIFNSQGNLEKAITNYKKAIEYDPNYAEAYCNLGNIFQSTGDIDDAIKCYNKSIEINPKFHENYNNLGKVYLEQEKLELAIENFQKSLKINPNNQTAIHSLNALKGHQTKTAPKEYITDLFDQYAHHFEKSLVDDLCYKMPKYIAKLLITKPSKSLGSILDLGCGTGLVGLELKSNCNYIEGIDLSSAMIAKAKQKSIYDKLVATNILDYLSEKNLNFDYFIAADVFVYLGDLYDIFKLIKTRNKKSGKLIFSTEHTDGEGYSLEKTGRYSHSKNYILSLCKELNMSVCQFITKPLRKENNSFINGGIYILEF